MYTHGAHSPSLSLSANTAAQATGKKVRTGAQRIIRFDSSPFTYTPTKSTFLQKQ